MGARLARFTGNSTFADYSEETWNWLTSVGFIDNETWAVYDGAFVEDNCTDILQGQWSGNAASLTQGAAFMYNYVSPLSSIKPHRKTADTATPKTNGSDVWRERAEKLSDSLLETFFPDGIAYEPSCEGSLMSCPGDVLFMKGYTHRWLSSAAQVAPFLADKLLPTLRTSAEAAAAQCVESDGGDVSQRCGFFWSNGTFVDPAPSGGTSGAGEGLDVFSAVTSLLVADAAAPATAATSGGAGNSSGTGQDGSPSGTADGSSPSGTAASDSGAGRFRAEITMLLLVSVMVVFAWAF